MKNASAARSGYGPVFLRPLSLHAANMAMAALCGAATWSLTLQAGAPAVVGLGSAVLFALVTLLAATATIPAAPRIRPAARRSLFGRLSRPSSRRRSEPREAPFQRTAPPPLTETRHQPVTIIPPLRADGAARQRPVHRGGDAVPALAAKVGSELDQAYAVLEAEWLELARLARRKRRAGSVLAA